jgi:hypothetical protein
MTAARDIMLPADKQSLKVAFAASVRSAGGVEAAAGFVRIGKSQLSDCGRTNTDAFAPIDVVADLQDITAGLPGAPHVLNALAARAGFALVALPGCEPTGSDWLSGMAIIAARVGLMMDVTGKAIADGKVDVDEAFDIDAVIDEALTDLMRMRALARSVRG